MQQAQAIATLNPFAQRGRSVFTQGDLARLFHEDRAKALQESLLRLVRANVLARAMRGIYVYAMAPPHPHLIEQIAATARRGAYSYVSLESALAEHGLISQAPVDRLTVMTTGRRGVYSTPWGTLEFTHTKRAPKDVLARSADVGRPLRFATREAALEDLQRVGRNLHLVQPTEEPGLE